MKKLLSLCTLLTIFILQSNAQFKQIAAGPEFDEPEEGFAKIIKLKNGNIFYLNVGPKEGAHVRIYDKDHHETAVSDFMPGYGKLELLDAAGVFEVNGDVVALISMAEKRTPTLYRIIIDGSTGKSKKEDKIGELRKITMGLAYGYVFSGNMDEPGFTAAYDSLSESYAVTLYNTMASEKDKKIEVILFNKQHEEISRSFVNPPDEQYKMLRPVDMLVLGEDRVCMLYNAFSSRKKERGVIMAALKKGSSTVTYTDLSLPRDSSIENDFMVYDRANKRLIIAAKMYLTDGSKEANVYIAFVNPDTYATENVFQTGISGALGERYAQIHGKKRRFSGTPVGLYLNRDGGFTVAYEEIAYISAYFSNGMSASHFETYDISVATYDAGGNIKSNYLVPKNYWIDNYHSASYKGGFANKYKTFRFINSPGNNYLLMNDTRRNIEKLQDNKEPVQIQGIGDCDAFYFPLTGTDPVPARKYLYGQADDSKDRSLTPLGVSVYDEKNDVFVTLRLNKSGRKKTVSIAWLKPE